MTPILLVILLGSGLVALAVAGPWLLRRAAPALVRFPRLAIAVIAGGILTWLVALLAIGPVLAWTGSGPELLAGKAAAVCQRCLDASSPFTSEDSQTAIPAVLLLAVPAVVALVLAVAVARRLLRARGRSRAAARALTLGARQDTVLEYAVTVVDDDHPYALTFAARHGGIVISAAALRALNEDELRAVLAHEAAHLRQRHHPISTLVDALAAYLRWVPLVNAAATALPHYVEIAADRHATDEAGTPALVSALLKLGERSNHSLPAGVGTEALHAAGPERIRQLVMPSVGFAGALPALAIASYLLALAVISVAVQLPYASAALSGC